MIETTTSSKTFLGNNSATEFPVTEFGILEDSYVSVYVIESDGTETLLVLDTDFSVTYDEETLNFTINYPLSGSPLATGNSLRVDRSTPRTQQTNLSNTGFFNAENVERAFDKVTMLVQEVETKADRALEVEIDVQGILNDANDAKDAAESASAAAALSSSAASTAKNAAQAAQVAAEEAAASVGNYTAPGTGSVARSVSSKLSDEVSVLDYAASVSNIRNELENAVTAFNKAVTYLGTLPNGGVVRVPAGLYRFTYSGSSYPRIGLPSNVYIVCDEGARFIVDGGSLANSGVHIYGTSLIYNKDMLTTGNKNCGVIGGEFKSLNAAYGSTGNGGFISFKNCLNPKVRGVKLLDTYGSARFQASFCYGGRFDFDSIDYETPHGTSWSYEDGIRIGSGCTSCEVSFNTIRSGDDCVAINNEACECQDVFTSPIDARIPASNTAGADIAYIKVRGNFVSNYNGNAVRLYVGPGMTSGEVHNIDIDIPFAWTKSPSSGGTIVSMLDSGSAGANHIHDVRLKFKYWIAWDLTPSGTPGAIQIGANIADVDIDMGSLVGVTATYGVVTGTRTRLKGGVVNGCVADGVYVAGTHCVIEGVQFSSIGTNAMRLSSAAQHTQLKGNDVLSATGYGVVEDAGADYTIAIGNDLTVGGASLGSSGSHSIYMNNPGLNPGGTASVGTTGSPMTITALYSTEIITVAGGTVSNISVGGANTGLTSGTFTLPPRTSMVITYSSGPTITKTRT